MQLRPWFRARRSINWSLGFGPAVDLGARFDLALLKFAVTPLIGDEFLFSDSDCTEAQ